MIDPPEVIWLGNIMDKKIEAAFKARGFDISHEMALAGAAKLRERASDIYYDAPDAAFHEIAVEIFRAMVESGKT